MRKIKFFSVFLFLFFGQFRHYFVLADSTKYSPMSGDCVEHCMGCTENDDANAKEKKQFWECPLMENDGKFRIERIFFKPGSHFDDDKCPRMNGSNEGEGKQMMAFQFCPNEQKDSSAVGGESKCTDGFLICFLSFLDPNRTLDSIKAKFAVANSEKNRVAQICNQDGGANAVDEKTGLLLTELEGKNPGIYHGFEVRNIGGGGKEFKLRTSTSDKIFKYEVQNKGNCLRILLFEDGTLFNTQFYSVDEVENKIIEGPLKAKIYSENGGAKNEMEETNVDIMALANGIFLHGEGQNNEAKLLGMDMMLRPEHPFYLKTFTPAKGGHCIPIPKVSLLSNIVMPVRKCKKKEGKIVECVNQVENGWEPMNGAINGIQIDEVGKTTVMNQQETLLNLSLATEHHQIIRFDLIFHDFSKECLKAMTDEICIKSPYSNLLIYFNNVPREECAIRIGRTKTHACISIGNSTTDTFEVDPYKNENEMHMDDKAKEGIDEEEEKIDRILAIEIKNQGLKRMRDWMVDTRMVQTLRLPKVCAVQNHPIQQYGMVFDVIQPYVLNVSAHFGWHTPNCSNAISIKFGEEYLPLMPMHAEENKEK